MPFTKYPSSELQEFLGKVLPLDFIQFNPIAILLWNEWFGWLHDIWVRNGKTSLLSFCGYIFPHPSPIIWLLRSCHIDRSFFLKYNELLYPLHVSLCLDVGRATCYQAMPLITCRMNYWQCFYSTRACSPFWLIRNRLILVSNSWCNMPFKFSLLP